ncbi:protoporphyrinogen oxidase [Haloplanus aerogenes]|uniref:Protoporphyrinogen oxidase n=1 Tax=Haloplanus aerogenes TaxID=660522 RepID=A0A3G8QRZ9_9EURY|nr:protoporphyrinogen oxidase [Haloplanus aerogenes]AZH24222.1 protoporphyrinogen oxidase [Haloplanus aerogenes]RMB24152.1 oxygen-dependent protoporphyrinogen oxidase [Haloplanus aerogenes]
MRVGIVGAGITGLALAHYCRERDVDAVAFEASSEPGGVIRSSRVDGRVLEHGPQRTRLTPEIEALVEDCGLRSDLRTADTDLPLYVYVDGRLRQVPFSPRAFLSTDLLSLRGKVRMLAEPLTEGARDDETAADYFVRKFGREAYHNLVEPLFGGIYGSDPAEMPGKYALQTVKKMERSGSLIRAAVNRRLEGKERQPPVSFDDGMAQLPRALSEHNADRVELETAVERIALDGSGYRLETEDGSRTVDHVVVTARADVAAGLLADVDTGSARALRRLYYNPLAYVHLYSDADPAGYGYQVRHDEPLRTLGVTWNASLFDRDGVYTCFLGGMENPGMVDRSERELGRIATEEFEAVMGADAEVLNVTKHPRGIPAYDGSWTAMADVNLPDGITLASNYAGRMGVPARVREAKRLAERFAESETTAAAEATG